jgi:hypothetical protein
VKKEGPHRISQSNYGFEVCTEYNPTTYDAHIGVKPRIDSTDGRAYVNGTIEWVIFKVSFIRDNLNSTMANLMNLQGQIVPACREYPITVYRVFTATRKTFKCEEILWVSDADNAKSYYRYNHPMNRGVKDTDSAEAKAQYPAWSQGKHIML